jgi:MFS family permease
VASTAGPGYAFLAAAAGNLAFALLLIPLKVGGRDPSRRKADATVRAGFAYVRRHADIMLLLLGVVAISFGADPVLTLTPAIADETGAGSGGVGAMVSSFGIGAALALFAIRPIQRKFGIARAATLGLLLLAVGNAGAAASFSLVSAALSFGVAGVGMSVALPSFSTQIQQRVSDEFRGRVMALWIVAFQGTRPLAALMSGGLADAISTPVALCTAATVVAAVAWLCRPARIG